MSGMCTVSLFRLSDNDFILTTNRDEAPDRITHNPRIYAEESSFLLYPKDSRAGGTWIGLSDRNRLVCVLNGAFKKHERYPPYKLSRGQIAKSLLVTDRLIQTLEDIDLKNVEPFTMIILKWDSNLEVLEWVWDSEEKHLRKITEEKRIWSSSSLYNDAMKEARLSWFSRFVSQNKQHPESIWDFHHIGGEENSNFGVIIDRGHVRTTSVTQVTKTGDEIVMRYEDLQKGDICKVPFKIPELNNG